MTYTLEIPIEAAHMAEAQKRAWPILATLPEWTPYRLKLKLEEKPQPPTQPQGPRAWTRAELSLIEDGIVPASRRYDAEFVAAVKAKAEGGAR